MDLTIERLKEAKFRGPVVFSDGANGLAQQDYESTDVPRFGYVWRRENRQDKGRIIYTVDGHQVADLDEALRLLNEAPREHPLAFLRDPERRRVFFLSSDPECNAAVGPFAMVRSAEHRVGNAWHQGINRYSDTLREQGKEWPKWLYRTREAAGEASRAMYLWAADRKEDTDLRCGLGVRCRDCPILATIEATIVERREKPMGKLPPRSITDDDLDMAKTWTCIGHILSEAGERYIDGFFYTKDDRDS